MIELKTVKQVCTLTGLNRKQLFDYADVVKPAEYANEAKYKMYDDEAIDKLHQISLYIQLGRARKKIKEIFKDPNYDRNKVLAKIINELEEEKIKIEKKISVANKLKIVGVKNIELQFSTKHDVNYLAMEMEEKLESTLYKAIADKTLSEKEIEEYIIILTGFKSLREKPNYKMNAQKQVEKLGDYLVTHYNLKEPKYLLLLSMVLRGGGEGAAEVDKYVGAGMAEYISFIISDVIIKYFVEEFFVVYKRIKNIKDKGFIDKTVQEQVKQIEIIYNKYFVENLNKSFLEQARDLVKGKEKDNQFLEFYLAAIQYYESEKVY